MLAILASVVALRIPAVTAGYFLDDFAHMAMAKGLAPFERAPWDYFTFVRDEAHLRRLVDAGALPWWTDPEIRIAFFRPLSSLLLFLDDKLFGVGELGRHLHSLAWWALLVVLASRIYGRVLGVLGMAIATAAFAVDDAHVTSLSWVANRSALVAAALSAAALLFDLRARSRAGSGAKTDARLADGFSVLSLFAGEYAVSGLGYRIALAAVCEKRPGPWPRVLGVLRLATMIAMLLLVRRVLGLEVRAFAVYRDPAVDPASFVTWAIRQAGSLVGDLVMGFPAGMAMPLFGFLWGAMGAAALYLVGRRAIAEDERRTFDALALGTVLSLLPLVATIAHSRLLVLPALGFSLVLAAAACRAVQVVRSGSIKERLVAWPVALAAMGFHLVIAPWVGYAATKIVQPLYGARLRAILDAPIDDDRVHAQTVVLVSGGDPTSVWYFPVVRALFDRPRPGAFVVLTSVPSAQIARRPEPNVLELEQRGSGLLRSRDAWMLRPMDKGLPVGAVVRAGPMEATVLARGAEGPTVERYRFDVPLDDPSLVFVTSTPRGFVRFEPPPVGGTTSVAPGQDPVWGPAR